MDKIQLIGKDDTVKYIKLDGKSELYRVTSGIEPSFYGYMFELTIINQYGSLGNKKFTTLLTKKDGKQRIFRLWLQLEDKVLMTDSKLTGKVFSIYKDADDNSIIIEIQCEESKQYLYTLEQAEKHLKLLHF